MTRDDAACVSPAWAWGGLVLTLLGPFVYGAAMGYPMLRATGLPAWLLMGAGLAMCVQTARLAHRRTPWVLAGVSGALLGLFVYAFFFMAALPESKAAEVKRAPDFTLNDHAGRPFHLSEELTKGPILLVFYRGHW